MDWEHASLVELEFSLYIFSKVLPHFPSFPPRIQHACNLLKHGNWNDFDSRIVINLFHRLIKIKCTSK
jgi:hypothetical protein